MEPLKKLNTRLEIQEGMTVKDVQAKGNAAQKAAAILFDFNGDGEFDYYEAYSFNQSRIAYDANNGEVRLYDKDKPNGTAPVETVNIEEAKAEYSKKSAKYQKFAQTLTHFGIDVSSAEWVGINDCEVKTVNGKTYLILKAVPQTPEPDPNESSYSIESHFELSIPIDKDFDPKNIIMYRAEDECNVHFDNVKGTLTILGGETREHGYAFGGNSNVTVVGKDGVADKIAVEDNATEVKYRFPLIENDENILEITAYNVDGIASDTRKIKANK